MKNYSNDFIVIYFVLIKLLIELAWFVMRLGHEVLMFKKFDRKGKVYLHSIENSRSPDAYFVPEKFFIDLVLLLWAHE